jgi:hypothetical protein
MKNIRGEIYKMHISPPIIFTTIGLGFMVITLFIIGAVGQDICRER